MLWLITAFVAAGGGGFLAHRWRERVAVRGQARAELEGVRELADEDVTILGEQLQRLDREVAGRELDEPTRVDYQVALDSYESAQRAVSHISAADDISKITDTLSSGRYALACVQARVAGQPLPTFRVPCFFNPQHGPSVADVIWTAPRGQGTRTVPACAQDAARLANREAPEVRTVTIGFRKVPYWEAGAAFMPYSEGYFAKAAMLTWAFQAQAASGGAHGFGGDIGHGIGHGGDFGHGAGFGGGGFDGGGSDGGGGN